MNYTIHGILQDRILEWVAFPFSEKVHPVKAVILPAVMYGCESWTIKVSTKEWMLLNCGVGEDS